VGREREVSSTLGEWMNESPYIEASGRETIPVEVLRSVELCSRVESASNSLPASRRRAHRDVGSAATVLSRGRVYERSSGSQQRQEDAIEVHVVPGRGGEREAGRMKWEANLGLDRISNLPLELGSVP